MPVIGGKRRSSWTSSCCGTVSVAGLFASHRASAYLLRPVEGRFWFCPWHAWRVSVECRRLSFREETRPENCETSDFGNARPKTDRVLSTVWPGKRFRRLLTNLWDTLKLQCYTFWEDFNFIGPHSIKLFHTKWYEKAVRLIWCIEVCVRSSPFSFHILLFFLEYEIAWNMEETSPYFPEYEIIRMAFFVLLCVNHWNFN